MIRKLSFFAVTAVAVGAATAHPYALALAIMEHTRRRRTRAALWWKLSNICREAVIRSPAREARSSTGAPSSRAIAAGAAHISFAGARVLIAL
jgi:hypothetical protein